MSYTTALQEAMHAIAQSLLTPSVIAVLLMIAVTVLELGGFLTEWLLEHRKLKTDIPNLLRKISDSGTDRIPMLIENSGLLKRHREAFLTLLKNREMSRAAMTALAERLLAAEDHHYQKSLEVPEIICKVGPMFGLLGTLIPLGPGLQALGQGNVQLLSTSMLVAFDTTICGIISAGVCFIIATVRRRWYNDYLSSLESILESLLEKTHPEKEELEDELDRRSA